MCGLIMTNKNRPQFLDFEILFYFTSVFDAMKSYLMQFGLVNKTIWLGLEKKVWLNYIMLQG